MKDTVVYLKVRLVVVHEDELENDEVREMVADGCDYHFKMIDDDRIEIVDTEIVEALKIDE